MIYSKLKPIVLDSSTWIKAILSNELKSRIDSLYSQGFIPIFTWHNFEELLSTDNDDLRKKRLIQLSSLDCFYKFRDINGPAKNIDIATYEYEYILTLGNEVINHQKLMEFVFSKLEVIKGESLLGGLDSHTEFLSKNFNKRTAGVYFASLPGKLHHDCFNANKTKLSELDPGRILNSEIFHKQKQRIINNFEKKGDLKKKQYLSSVDKFLDNLREKGISLLNNNNNLQFFAELAGIPQDILSSDMTFESYVKTIHDFGKIDIIASKLKRNPKELFKMIDLVPTLLLDKLFLESYNKKILTNENNKAEASSIVSLHSNGNFYRLN